MNCQKALELVWCIQNLRDVREIDPGSNPEKVERRIVAPDGGTARYDSGGRAGDYSAGISPGGGGVPDAVWTFTGRAVATGSRLFSQPEQSRAPVREVSSLAHHKAGWRLSHRLLDARDWRPHPLDRTGIAHRGRNTGEKKWPRLLGAVGGLARAYCATLYASRVEPLTSPSCLAKA